MNVSNIDESSQSSTEPFVNVASGEYDGRDFTGQDNNENVSAYVGVDPIYQNYANEGEKPHPFTEDELVTAAERGGLEVEDVLVDHEEGDASGGEGGEVDDEGDGQKPSIKSADSVTAPAPPTAPVPAQRKAPATRAASKDAKSSDADEKK